MSRKKAVIGMMVAKMRAGVERPLLGEDEADDEVEEGGGEVEVEVGVEEAGEGGADEEDGVVGETEAADDLAVLAELGEAVIGIGIIDEGVSTAVVTPSSPSVPLGSSGTPAVGVAAGEVEPPKVHPSPSGIDGP